MNTIKRVKLLHLREKIVQDLDVRDIMEYLLSAGAVSSEDAKQICSERVRTDQTRHLLDLLPQKGLEAFDIFVESLKKDYDWLYSEFTESNCETDSADEKTFYDAFLVGGVPRPPPYNVVRQKKLDEIQRQLNALKRGNYVVLHGMTGCGKSCLAAAAIDNKRLLMQSFKGSVYWLTVGDSDDEELSSHMTQLLQRLELSSRFNHNAIIADKALVSKEKGKEELKRSFLEGSLREGLLILDDVTSEKHIDAFDIGCKIMVCTKDLHVMNKVKGRYDLIKVNDGLTESESLLLLAQSIGIPVEQLPRQAKIIHSLSQGSPMVMALIAGHLEDNQDDARSSDGRWNYYINMLSEKTYGSRRNSLLAQNGLFQTISMSISNLPSDKKNYYSDFALFMEDVNIKPEVLQTLWGLQTKYEAEDIMAFFTKKSLAVCKWNEQFQSSVYGIHDLLLHYLKEQIVSQDKKQDLHRKLLKSYFLKCNGEYSKLPNDNYIYSYIGYHMYHAGEWGLFEKVFFDLEFIQSKLRVTGPADMLADLKKYRKRIIGNNSDLNEKLNDFIRFIQVYGLDLYKDKDLDIVQCGLLERKDSYVYKDAYNIAKVSTSKMYFDFLSDQDLISHPLTLPLREEIISACFTNDIDKILVADENGIICLWGLESFKLISTYKGHRFKVTHLELHPDGQRFLSCSEDGTLKLWSLDYVRQDRIELNSAGDNLRVSSPQCVQQNWKSMFLDDSPKDESLKTYIKHDNAVLYAKFSQSGDKIVSCSKECYIVWNCESGEPCFRLEVSGGNMATCCTFACDDSLLFFGGTDSVLRIYNSETSEFVASFCNTGSIVAVFSVPSYNNKIVVISIEEIRIWLWDEPEISQKKQNQIFSGKQSRSVTFSMGKISYHSFGKRNNCKYVCASYSNDGTYLVAASSDHVISVWALETETLIAEHKNDSGVAKCLDTYVGDSIPLLLCGSDDQSVKIWHLDQSSTVSSINLQPNFHSVWVKETEWIPKVATADSKNRLQVLQGSTVVAQSPIETEEITKCVVSDSGCDIFYGCVDGQIKKFDIKSKSCEIIMKLNGRINYLQFLKNGNTCLVTAGDINGLKIWRQDTNVIVCYGQTAPVVQCFLLPDAAHLLACNEDASVKLWNIEDGKLSQVLVGRLANAHITSADMSERTNILVLGDENTRFHTASLALHSEFPFVNVNSLKTNEIDTCVNPVQCCKISPCGVLLAVGLNSGCVLIWNLMSLQQIKKLLLHNSPVHSLLFATYDASNNTSRNAVFLTTVGEKIGWWNITDLLAVSKSSTNIGKNANNSREHLYPTTLVKELFANHQETANRNNLSNVKVKNKSLLVGCMKLLGSHALNISSSPDFFYFLTVDTSGIVYYLRLLK